MFLPIIPSDDLAAFSASTFASHPESRIRFCKTVVVGEFLTLLDISNRNEITFAVEAYITITRMIKVPFDRKLIEIHVLGRDKTLRRANAEIPDFLLRCVIESPPLAPRNKGPKILLSEPIRNLPTLLNWFGRKNTDASNP